MLPEYEIRKALLVRLIEKHLPKRAIELTYMVAALKDKQVDDWLNAIIVEHCAGLCVAGRSGNKGGRPKGGRSRAADYEQRLFSAVNLSKPEKYHFNANDVFPRIYKEIPALEVIPNKTNLKSDSVNTGHTQYRRTEAEATKYQKAYDSTFQARWAKFISECRPETSLILERYFKANNEDEKKSLFQEIIDSPDGQEFEILFKTYDDAWTELGLLLNLKHKYDE